MTAALLDTFPAPLAEALSAGRVGPELRRAVRAPAGAACHVLDAKWQAADQVTVLYAVAGRLVTLTCDGPARRLTCFPEDPALPALAQLLDPAGAAAAVRRALADSPGPRVDRLRQCAVEVLRYRPAKRATLLLRPRWPGGHAVRRGEVVAKVYHDPGKAAAVAAEGARLAAAVPPDGPLGLAPALGSVPELSVVLQGRVSGAVLDDVLAGPQQVAAERVEQAARATAVLHRLPAVTSRRRPVARELERFASRAAVARALAPSAASALADLAARLAALEPLLPAGTERVVHGDCKPSQFLCRPCGVVLLDLDHCGLADPAADVGTFLASLRQRAEREATSRRPCRCGPARLAGLADRYRAAYLDAGGPGVAERIIWYEAVALERKALRALARAPRSPLPVRLAAAAGERLDELAGGSRC